ncbi:GrpB family protein [Blastopirellula retiformator]|uniref:Dephospho-CoA kinase/protein folding accessory domain-containing protein n=1 Tax=Blastopirellula retiformator TaxID=2527970 RepID=A0A5C5VLX3_9BACT|nr:GrpB family protein [Blastopirellula retiformator]TWT39636.1 dephospho-CoA kinase/protein folding accessory domain-containing protein [Blastopirellula retiformator]
MSPLVLYAYDPRWPQAFEQMKSSLRFAAEGLISEVEHVGGTAIPLAPARDGVVDLLVAVENAEQLAAVAPYIEGLRFTPVETKLGGEGVLGEFRRPRVGSTPAYRLLMAPFEGDFWQRAIQFRIAISHCGGSTERYAQLKRRLATAGADGAQYELSKLVFFRHIEEQHSGGGALE